MVIAGLLFLSAILFWLFWRIYRWNRFVKSQVQQVNSTSEMPSKTIDWQQVEALPTIVQKYFHLVLKDNAHLIQKVHLRQIGGFRANPNAKDWSPMKAEQYFSPSLPGFFWQASIRVLPGMHIEVCDAFLNAKGFTKGTLAKVVNIIDAHDRPELDQGALQRYLAEAVWFPSALLPSQGVEWQAIDELHASATLSVGNTRATLIFEFNTDGEIRSVYCPDRYREVAGKFVPMPWKGYYANYVDIGEYKIPQQAEVAWLLPDQVYTYFKADVEPVLYE